MAIFCSTCISWSRGCVYLSEISTKKTPQEGKLRLFVSLIYMSRFIVVWDLLLEHFTVFSFFHTRFFPEIISLQFRFNGSNYLRYLEIIIFRFFFYINNNFKRMKKSTRMNKYKKQRRNKIKSNRTVDTKRMLGRPNLV